MFGPLMVGTCTSRPSSATTLSEMPAPIPQKMTHHKISSAASSTGIPAAQNTVGTESVLNSGDATDSSCGTPFDNLASLIPSCNKWNLGSPARLAYRTRVKIEKCLQLGKGCYVYVNGVTATTLTQIDNALESYGIRRQVRIMFEPGFSCIIIKCIVGVPHERIRWTFMTEIMDKICEISNHGKDSYHPTGCRRYWGKSGGCNEGDGGLAPAGTRDGEEAWPSIVLEVGDSQRIEALHACAVWWLTESNSQTRMVILINLTKEPVNLRLELWAMVTDPENPGTQSRPRKIPGFKQFFNLNSEGKVINHHEEYQNLVIPYRTIFDVPHDDAINITLSQADLKAWILRLSKGLSWD